MMKLINTCSQPVESAPAWRKSSFCGSAANCVEVAALPDGGRGVRDGKNPEGPSLRFGATSWAEFLMAVRAGDFDPRE